MPASILIPALNPTARLTALLADLLAADSSLRVILINDGSSPHCRALFNQAAASPRVQLIEHPQNLGKGAALRTGIRRFLDTAGETDSLITADADGQHLPADILSIAAAAATAPAHLILGSRAFTGAVPFRSRIGNILTRRIFRIFTGADLIDTQTGLRSIPRSLMPDLLALRASRYDFELEMLLIAAQKKIPITAAPIQTIYLEGDTASHFKPIRDSARVYRVFLRRLFKS